jgi:hypothetical protein
MCLTHMVFEMVIVNGGQQISNQYSVIGVPIVPRVCVMWLLEGV